MTQKNLTAKKSMNGFSLVEMLVAFALSLLVIAAVVQLLLANRQSVQISQAMVRVQESGRFAIEFLSSAIRRAGQYSCVSSLNATENTIAWLNDDYVDVQAIQTQVPTALANQWQSSSDGGVSLTSDRLSLLVATTNDAIVHSVSGETIFFTGDGEFSSGDVVALGNCQFSDLTFISQVSANYITLERAARAEASLEQGTPLMLTELQHLSFFISDENLTVEINGGASWALVNGVEALQFEYGVDTDSDSVVEYFSDIDSIQQADQAANIIAVRIGLIAVSATIEEGAPQKLTQQTQTLYLLGQRYVASDFRYRAVFQTTVALTHRGKL